MKEEKTVGIGKDSGICEVGADEMMKEGDRKDSEVARLGGEVPRKTAKSEFAIK